MTGATLTTSAPAQTDKTAHISVLTMYVEDLGRIGSRHENIRTFYLSVISALLVFLSLADDTAILAKAGDTVRFTAGVVGILICVTWFLQMLSFANLFSVKKEVIREIESNLPIQPFTDERTKLKTKKHLRLTLIDRAVAIICGLLFIGLLADLV